MLYKLLNFYILPVAHKHSTPYRVIGYRLTTLQKVAGPSVAAASSAYTLPNVYYHTVHGLSRGPAFAFPNFTYKHMYAIFKNHVKKISQGQWHCPPETTGLFLRSSASVLVFLDHVTSPFE